MSCSRILTAALAVALAVPVTSNAAPVPGPDDTAIIQIIPVMDAPRGSNGEIDVNAALSSAGYRNFSEGRDGFLHASLSRDDFELNRSRTMTSIVNVAPVGKDVIFSSEHSEKYVGIKDQAIPYPNQYKSGIRGFLNVKKSGQDVDISFETNSAYMSGMETMIKGSDVNVPSVISEQGEFSFTHLKPKQNTAVVPGIWSIDDKKAVITVSLMSQ